MIIDIMIQWRYLYQNIPTASTVCQAIYSHRLNKHGV